MHDPDDFEEDDEFEDQIEEVIAQNGILLHALVEVLIRKGIVRQEEIEAQIDQFAAEVDEDVERE